MAQIGRYSADRKFCPVCKRETQHYQIVNSKHASRLNRQIFCEVCRVICIEFRNAPDRPWE